MADSFLNIYEKYYNTKSISTIRDYFINNANKVIWEVLKEQIEKEYLVIPNLNTWSQDFVLGNTEEVYLSDFILEPYTHNIVPKNFNTYGNIAFGDMINVLKTCTMYNVGKIKIMDFVAVISMLSSMISMSKTVFSGHSNVLDMSVECCMIMDWLVRTTLSTLVCDNNISHTSYEIHLPTFAETVLQVHYNVKDMSPLAPKVFSKITHGSINHKYICTSAYFAHVSGLKLKDNFDKPTLVYHETLATESDKTILTYAGIKKRIACIEELINSGTKGAYDKIKTSLSSWDKKYIKNVFKSDTGSEVVFNPDMSLAHISSILHSRKTLPDGIAIIQENPYHNKDILNRKRTPIASCIINVDKIVFDNSTKDENWIINTINMLYSNAQDINRLRLSLQTNWLEHPLLVTLIVTDRDLREKLEKTIDKINLTLKSTYDLNFTYKFKEVI